MLIKNIKTISKVLIVNTFLIILFIFLGGSKELYAQLLPDTSFRNIFPRDQDNNVVYEHIVEMDSLSKKEITLRIKEWAIKSFNSQKVALQTEDVDAGYILYQTVIPKTYKIPKGWGFTLLGTTIYTITMNTKFSINFYIKDTKFKVTINNVSNKVVSAYGIWMNGLSSDIGERTVNEPDVKIEDAGNETIKEYLNNPKEKKYIIRLNFWANVWREIDMDCRGLLKYTESQVKAQKKSAFDF
jgi:hypothetical protein